MSPRWPPRRWGWIAGLAMAAGIAAGAVGILTPSTAVGLVARFVSCALISGAVAFTVVVRRISAMLEKERDHV